MGAGSGQRRFIDIDDRVIVHQIEADGARAAGGAGTRADGDGVVRTASGKAGHGWGGAGNAARNHREVGGINEEDVLAESDGEIHAAGAGRAWVGADDGV